MASLFMFTLNTAEQVDLFYSDETGQLNLEQLLSAMIERTAPKANNGTITGEGFTNIALRKRGDIPLIECFATAQSSLGYFYEARIENDDIKTHKIQHKYYSKSSIVISKDSRVIIKFDWAAEEAAKTKVKSLVESLGLEAISFKITDALLREIQGQYKWTAAKIDKIEKAGDSTRRVSYEIDPSDDQFQSQVDIDYRTHGKMSHINFELPYSSKSKHPSTPDVITVKLYSEGGNRIVIDENEFGSPDDFRNFHVYLMETLFNINSKIGE